ncbi:MAG: prepilin-type N-terminal cleavage/methylation domain-containing protein, partial [Pseudomonadota bacterium]
MARQTTQRGYTLIEIMIALTIGVFLTGGMLNLYIGSKRAYNIQSTLTELQEVGRFGIKSMIEDIRMAGFFGCGTTASVVNVLTGGAANWEINAAEPLRGFDAGVSVFPPNFAGNVVANTDALVLLRTQPSDAYVVDTHSTAANQLTLKDPHDLQQGEILAVTDCLNTAIFQQTNANAASVATTVDHAAGTTVPGNCAPGLGGPVDCAAGTSQPYQFPEESFITRVISRAYYIGNGASGRSALFRLDINNTG